MTSPDAPAADAAPAESPDTAHRVTDLEVRLAFLEHTLSQLDEVLRETADEVLRMRRMMTELQQRVEKATDPGGGDTPTDLEYERPPHY